MARERSTSGIGAAAGAAAGLVGGVLMAGFTMLYTAAAFGDLWWPLRMMGQTFSYDAGIRTVEAGAGVLLWGMLIHLVMSAALGMVFALVFTPRTNGMALAGGLIYGVVVAIATSFLVLPWANPTMAAAVMTIPFVWFVAHLFYGAGLALTPAFARSGERRRV